MLSSCHPNKRDEAAASEHLLPPSVLIAEDEHLVASDLADQLQRLHVQVVGPASTGAAAIELAKTQEPAMALLDIRMSDVDGLEAAARLMQMGIPAVILSAYSDEEYLIRSTRAGVFGYLIKPVAEDALRTALAVAWARFNQQCELQQEVTKLKTALEDRKLVERAKGVIMDKLGLKEADAMRRLQKQARDSRRTLADMARAILESNDLFEK